MNDTNIPGSVRPTPGRKFRIISWSKPGNVKIPQKQNKNPDFSPCQAAGRAPGKLGGNMPVKLAEMRGKKSSKPSRFVVAPAPLPVVLPSLLPQF